MRHIVVGVSTRRLLVRAFMVASVFALIQILTRSDCNLRFALKKTTPLNGALLKPFLSVFKTMDDVNVTIDVARELLSMNLVDYERKSLCLSKSSAIAAYALKDIGFTDIHGFQRLSLSRKWLTHKLQYPNGLFEFVLSGHVSELSVPAMLVLEIERVLKPGGIGAMLVESRDRNPNSLIRSATPVSSLLKTSRVVHVGHVSNFVLVVFRKKIFDDSYFEDFRLPESCPSIEMGKTMNQFLEPITDSKKLGFERTISYLSKYMRLSSEKRLVYIEIGVTGLLNFSDKASILNAYPINGDLFNVFIVDHNASVLISCAEKPGITFVYYPRLHDHEGDALHGEKFNGPNPYPDNNRFDFLAWVKETVENADFAVLKVKSGQTRLIQNFFRTGAICFVDEIFLECSDEGDGDCSDLFRSLRMSGVYVHRWWSS